MVWDVGDCRWHFRQPGGDSCPQSSFPRYELVAVFRQPDEKRLEYPVTLNRFNQVCEWFLSEYASGLHRVDTDRADGDPNEHDRLVNLLVGRLAVHAVMLHVEHYSRWLTRHALGGHNLSVHRVVALSVWTRRKYLCLGWASTMSVTCLVAETSVRVDLRIRV